MPAPLVSVILPTFNRLHYLRQTIDSVFAQTLRDWELVIADDGSDGSTQDYLRSMAGHDRVRAVWLQHTGMPARVRNAALRAACGRFVAFLDSDDVWTPVKLEQQATLLRQRADCQWSYTAYTQIDSAGAPLPGEAGRCWRSLDGDLFDAVCSGSASIQTSSVLASRELVESCGAFDECIASGEDQDLWMRLALHSRVVLVDEPLLLRRRHAEQFSNDWEPAYAHRYHTLAKIRLLAGPKWHSLLDHERTRNAARHADALTSRSRSLSALVVLQRSMPYSWRYAIWWRSVGKACATAVAGRAVKGWCGWLRRRTQQP